MRLSDDRLTAVGCGSSCDGPVERQERQSRSLTTCSFANRDVSYNRRRIIRIQVTKRNVKLEEGVREWVERRLQFALGRFSTQIRTVSIIFSDANGHRSGCDKHCRLRIMLEPSGEVVIEDTDPSVVEVVSNIAERAARSVSRVLERRREGRGDSQEIINISEPAGHSIKELKDV